ncbi:MAG TPA: hypothetical protein VKU60_13720 [Chloroflexota bacterium]|nr:hypothetical protein [Chloroflexota bacterium]
MDFPSSTSLVVTTIQSLLPNLDCLGGLTTLTDAEVDGGAAGAEAVGGAADAELDGAGASGTSTTISLGPDGTGALKSVSFLAAARKPVEVVTRQPVGRTMLVIRSKLSAWGDAG